MQIDYRAVREATGETDRQIGERDFEDVVWRAEAIQRRKAEEYRQLLTAASFAAWQIRAAQGDKSSWKKYSGALGLTEDKQPGDSGTTVDEAKAVAGRIHAQYLARKAQAENG